MLVSIIVPCFDSAPWLRGALDSCLNQTYQQVEIIVVDDGSTDESADIAKSYERFGVKVYSQPNRGACAARNFGLKHASGKYVQFLDADDLISPDKIECQVRLLQSSPEDTLCLAGTRYFYDGEDPDCGRLSDGWPTVDSDDPLGWLISMIGGDGKAGMVPPHAWLTPMKIAEAVGPWNEALTQDQDGEYFARVVLSAARIRRASCGLAYYRKHRSGKSVSVGRSEKHLRGRLLAIDLKAKLIFSRCESESAKRAIARHYFKLAFHAYPQFKGLAREAEQKALGLGSFEFKPNVNSILSPIHKYLGWRSARYVSFWHNKIRSAFSPK